MIRKTIKVETIKSMVNGMLLNSEDNYQQGRESLTFFLERVLMDTNNYRGFSYLSVVDMNDSHYGTSVGINLTEDKQFEPDSEKRLINTDHTRVRYF